jgi:hypothetical protein
LSVTPTGTVLHDDEPFAQVKITDVGENVSALDARRIPVPATRLSASRVRETLLADICQLHGSTGTDADGHISFIGQFALEL